MRDTTTPPPPSSRLRTPPTPKHGAGYHSYDPYEPRRSQRVQRLHNTHDKDSQSLSSRKSTLQRSSSTYTLSPPASPAAEQSQPQQTPARPTPVRQSLFTRNRPTNTPNTNSLFDVFAPQAQLPTPASMLPTPNKSPFKRDPNAMQTTARILNFKPTMSTMPTPRKKAKSRLTLDPDDAVHEDIEVFTDIQDRVPTVDRTEDNPFIGARKTRARTRAQTAPSSSLDVDMNDARADDEDDKGILYVFRGKKIFRRFEKSAAESTDSDASTGSSDSLKRQAGVSASRPLTRSSFKPRLLWPTANSDGDADEEALTDIDEDNVPSVESTLFPSVVQPTKTPAKKAVAHPATPPSSHRNTRSGAQQIAMFADPHNELNRALASPSTTPMAQKPTSGPLFAGWPRSKNADDKAARGEKRPRATMSEPELPAKRARSNLF
ncbi:hypothetical protein E4T52_03573 [Aureobasidium sp. EXF-3400]|nr:hypothetical protein E4T51_02700 [Aureobasidium sp. EXF-12344]KAI4781457.1 hypothetical protein E4T52_03573 [Aureobasidium sp. EXF-3400]